MVQGLNPVGKGDLFSTTIQTNTGAHLAFVHLVLKHPEDFNDSSPPFSTQVKE
jgi:hypothetical protein